MASRRRLGPEIFNLPVAKMRAGYYSDKYFVRVREIDGDEVEPWETVSACDPPHSSPCA